MLRLIAGFAVFALVMLGAAWLADRPGTVSVDWLGYRVDSSVGVLAAVILLGGLVVALLYMLWRGVIGAPGAWFGRRSEARRRRGYRALTLGMVAVAAGDSQEAQRQARRAENLLEEPPLTMLLSAQAAQLAGDKEAARRYFTTMLDDPETAFLGLRGLLMQAVKDGDTSRALSYAERAYAIRPTTPWVVQTLFDMQARAGQWVMAQQTLQGGLNHKVVQQERGRSLKAILLVERSRQAEAAGNAADATRFAREAFDTEPGRIPAAFRYAERLLAEGDKRRAMKVLKRAWGLHPHPDLAKLYLAATGEADPLKHVQALGELVAANPDDIESHVALAREALEARLWGEARRHLLKAGGDNPPARICRLMADLEESETGDGERVRYWLTRATLAPIDRQWRCHSCGAVGDRWQSVCGQCGAFGTIDWRPPLAIPLPPGAQPAAEDRPADLQPPPPAGAPPASLPTVIAADATMPPRANVDRAGVDRAAPDPAGADRREAGESQPKPVTVRPAAEILPPRIDPMA